MTERCRQVAQANEVEFFHQHGSPTGYHSNPDLYGSAWGDPYEATRLQPVRAMLENELRALGPGPSSCIDIGCGGGRWTRVIAAAKPANCRLIIVDGTPRAFDLTTRWLERNGLAAPDDAMACIDGDLALPSESLDLVFSFDAFVHFEPTLIAAYLQSIARVLKSGGKFLVNFACEFPGLDCWTRSDRWFEYMLTMEPRGLIFREGPWSDLSCHFDIPGPTLIHAMPDGYGSAFLVLTRNGVKV